MSEKSSIGEFLLELCKDRGVFSGRVLDVLKDTGSLFSDASPFVWPDKARAESPSQSDAESPSQSPSQSDVKSPWEGPFFGDANRDPETIVFSKTTFTKTAFERVNHRLYQMKILCNKGYGVVPITNHFTSRIKGDVVEQRARAMPDLTCPDRKMSTKSNPPPSPRLPDAEELRRASMILYQVGFANGRQGLFQGLSQMESGQEAQDCIGKWIVFDQDDGHDLGILRGIEPIQTLVFNIPETPFMRIVRLAEEADMKLVEERPRVEVAILAICKNVMKKTPFLFGMELEMCELQIDRNKVILYATMQNYVKFNAFVKNVGVSLEKELNIKARIFIQRCFV